MLDLKDVWTEYRDTGKADIRERIILDALPLVKYVVGKVTATVPSSCDYEELVQCGIFGLMDAVENYDPAKETKFETYAILRIWGAVVDELRRRDWVPRAKRKMARELDAFRWEFQSQRGTAPSVDELAAAMNIPCDRMEEILQETNEVSFISLDESRGFRHDDEDAGSTTIADMLADEAAAEPGSAIELEEKTRALGRAIAELPEQERIIVTLHYYEGMRLKDIGELYGVSESRISQVHGRALVLLKLKMESLLGV